MRGLWTVLCAWSWLAALVLCQDSASAANGSDYISIPGYGNLPSCSMECLLMVPTETECALTNQTCVCEQVQTGPFRDKMMACIQTSCTVKLALETQNVTTTTCGLPIRNRAQGYKLIAIVLGSIAALCVFQRFAFKIYSKLPLWWDDWLILIDMLAVVAGTAVNMEGAVPNGVGMDIWTLTPDMITGFMKAFHIMGSMYFVQITLLKVSLLCFYLRIFPTKMTRRLLWGTIAFNAVIGVIFLFLAIFHCRPVTYFWYQWDGEHEGSCNNLIVVTVTNAAIGIAIDFWMLALPLWELKSLNLHWKKKVGVALMFTVGTFVTVISILRLYYIIKFGEGNMNPTWDYADISTWSIVEINVGIICACMPAIRMLFVRMFPSFFGSTQRSHNEYVESGSNPWKSPNHGSTAEKASSRSAPSERITYQKTFTIEYSEDETRLVEMQDMERQSRESRESGKI